VIAICLLMNTLKVLDLTEDEGAQADSRVKLGRVDLGLTANVRPSLLINDYPGDELALVLGETFNSQQRTD
jgi:hypothetical protein